MSAPFTSLDAVAAALPTPNVDTDQIIPARYLAKPRPEQKAGLFHDLRFDETGKPRTAFPLNEPAYANAQILVAGHNFACGSSRENAVTALLDNGFRAFIAPSFGDIFYNNCFQNGCLPIVLPAERVAAILRELARRPGARISIDLAQQTVTGPDNETSRFEIDPFRKKGLYEGLDDISLTLTYNPDIEAFEARQKQGLSWL
jgi:3-isopropylmalate/(R)-2-methylmalate dehydratase small subunit